MLRRSLQYSALAGCGRERAVSARLLARRVDGIFIADYEQGEIGPDLFRVACTMGLEGIVSKRCDRAYGEGQCRHWIKVKNPAHPAYSRVRDTIIASRLASSAPVRSGYSVPPFPVLGAPAMRFKTLPCFPLRWPAEYTAKSDRFRKLPKTDLYRRHLRRRPQKVPRMCVGISDDETRSIIERK
jgi:hypothetical protein